MQKKRLLVVDVTFFADACTVAEMSQTTAKETTATKVAKTHGSGRKWKLASLLNFLLPSKTNDICTR